MQYTLLSRAQAIMISLIMVGTVVRFGQAAEGAEEAEAAKRLSDQ